MINNDVLRRLRYILDLSDDKMMKTFALGGLEANRSEISAWLKKDDDADFQKCNDVTLASFLNGLIVAKRGAKDGEVPVPETRLTNNIILRKLMIASELRTDDALKVLELGGANASKGELSAFFRKPEHRNFRECKDQVLRKFLSGLQVKLR
jgi:uncharacterized protein YehS (DUF1456 family)